MTTPRDAPKSDQPDKFDRLEFSKHLASLLYDHDRRQATGLVVGLTGPWGSGKSQTLHYVEKHLHQEFIDNWKEGDNPLILVSHNPWLHSGRDDLLQSFLESTHSEAKKHKAYDSKLKKIGDLFDQIKPVTNIIKTGLRSWAPTKQALDDLSKLPPLEDQKEKLLTEFSKNKVSVIVFLDELDRLSDEEIRVMMQVVKSIGDFPCFSYLLAYDPDRVAKALGGNDLKFGHNYLEKIVQVQTRLPRTPEKKMKEFIYEQFDSGPKFDHAVLETLLDTLVPEIIYTPRDARRFAAAYAARSRVRNDVDGHDLLKYCALETRIPVLSERLQNLATRVSVDGSRELERRSEPVLPSRDCLERLLDVFHDDGALKRIVLDLFPALEERGAEIIARDDNRLCYETSLLTLLNYGCPPNLVSVHEIEAVFADAKNIKEGILNLLNSAASRDCVRHANLRLRTICKRKKLDDPSTRELWRSIAHFFDQPIANDDMSRWSPWVDGAHIWPRGVLQDYLPATPITADFVKELIEDGSILLPSWILYFHIQARGLFGIEMRSSLRTVLDRHETTELSELAAKLMTQNILQEEKSWRLRSFIPLLIIKLLSDDRWTQVLDHLNSPKSILFSDAIAVLLLRTRHNKGPDGKALVDIMDVKKILEYWRTHRDPKEETRKPVDDAYRFLHAVTARSG